jgi:hypothetical protein
MFIFTEHPPMKDELLNTENMDEICPVIPAPVRPTYIHGTLETISAYSDVFKTFKSTKL